MSDKDKIAAIVLMAILSKADGETYGASYARKMNEDRAKEAAERIIALHTNRLPTEGDGTVSVELLNIERDTADRLREENSLLRAQPQGAPNKDALHRLLREYVGFESYEIAKLADAILAITRPQQT